MKLEIEEIDAFFKLLKDEPELAKKYFVRIVFDGKIYPDLINNKISNVLLNKNITYESIDNFVTTFTNKVIITDHEIIVDSIINPPFHIVDYKNQVVNLKELLDNKNLKNVDWILNYKFATGVNVGKFEAFIVLFFKHMSKPMKGDVMYNNIDIIEVKGAGGRLIGQSGYNNGNVEFIKKEMAKLGYSTDINNLHLNINSSNISTITVSIKHKEDKIAIETAKYNERLLDKEKRMNEASSNKQSKKYKNAHKQYNNFKKVLPASISTLNEEIFKLNENIKNCILENISIDLAKQSLNKSIEFLSNIYKRKYINADIAKIEEFLKNSLNSDGSFNNSFAKEYLIFEYYYYQFIEKFKYFCIFNIESNTMLIIDSIEKFREFVYSGNIVIKSYPSFSEHSGQQGMVFSVDVKN